MAMTEPMTTSTTTSTRTARFERAESDPREDGTVPVNDQGITLDVFLRETPDLEGRVVYLETLREDDLGGVHDVHYQEIEGVIGCCCDGQGALSLGKCRVRDRWDEDYGPVAEWDRQDFLTSEIECLELLPVGGFHLPGGDVRFPLTADEQARLVHHLSEDHVILFGPQPVIGPAPRYTLANLIDGVVPSDIPDFAESIRRSLDEMDLVYAYRKSHSPLRDGLIQRLQETRGMSETQETPVAVAAA